MALDVATLVRELAADDEGGEVEGMLVVGINGEGQVCGVAVNPRHRGLSFVKVWELSALAEELDACSLVVALFPPGGANAPSDHEVSAFTDLCARAHRAQVVLSDCLISRGGRTWSMRELSAEQHGG
jgi:hypothetical protein